MSKSRIVKLECQVRDGWGYLTFSKRAAYETQEFMRQCIIDQSQYGFGMDVIHRLSRMYLELDKGETLSMLSREDLDCLRKCMPGEIDSALNGFYRSNFFKPDNSRFNEANQICKGMFEIHEN